MSQHEWVEPKPESRIEWPYCRLCGVVRRADGQNRECRGPVPVTTRDQAALHDDERWRSR